jgi:peptidoglycan/LPS O-acetylase OafA/YrhL
LDGWRGVAILLVLVAHASAAMPTPPGRVLSWIFDNILRNGSCGVDLFFTLSGFLITNRLIRDKRKIGDFALLPFYLRRAFRIIPAYALFLFILAVISILFGVNVSRGEWMTCLLHIRNLLTYAPGHGWYTAHIWSLSIEEQFYLLWPVCLAMLGIRNGRTALVLAVLILPIWRNLDGQFGIVDAFIPGLNRSARTDLRFDGLLWGCLTAILFEYPTWLARSRRVLSPSKFPLLFFGFFAIVIFRPPLMTMLLGISAAALVACTMLNPHTLAGRMLELPWLRWVGRISYGLYLWQQIFLVSGSELAGRPLGLAQAFPLNVLAAFICATISFYLLERPMLRRGHELALLHEQKSKPSTLPCHRDEEMLL